MRRKNKSWHAVDRRRRILDMSLALFASGAALVIASSVVSTKPVLGAVGMSLEKPATWCIVLGAVLLLVYLVVRKPLPRLDGSGIDPAFGPSTSILQELIEFPLGDRSAPARPKPATEWSGNVFDEIEWRRFEAVCEALFAQAGFEARSQSHGAGGGVDIWLYSRNADVPAAVVQCKHWRKPVGVRQIREFFAVMVSHGLQRGTFATSSIFTADAAKFAKENGVNTLDRDGLLALIARRDEGQRQQLLSIAYQGEYWRPTCASCGVKMVERELRDGGDEFWGCPRFPQCRATLQMR